MIVSNCVINLSADKDRVLKGSVPGTETGRPVRRLRRRHPRRDSEEVRRDVLLWAGCIAGALDENDYRMKLATAGFEAIGDRAHARLQHRGCARVSERQGVDVDALAPQVEGKFMSAFVRASKPGPARGQGAACCAPSCCS